MLNVAFLEGKAGWGSVDNAADRRAVAFTPGRDPEEVAESVVRHGYLPTICWRPMLGPGLDRGDIRRVLRLHADHVIAAVDVMDRASGTAGEIT